MEGGGAHPFVACLSRLTIDHTFLSRWSTGSYSQRHLQQMGTCLLYTIHKNKLVLFPSSLAACGHHLSLSIATHKEAGVCVGGGITARCTVSEESRRSCNSWPRCRQPRLQHDNLGVAGSEGGDRRRGGGGGITARCSVLGRNIAAVHAMTAIPSVTNQLQQTTTNNCVIRHMTTNNSSSSILRTTLIYV